MGIALMQLGKRADRRDAIAVDGDRAIADYALLFPARIREDVLAAHEPCLRHRFAPAISCRIYDMGRLLALVIVCASLGAQASEFTRDELIKVLWHGPWPPARASHAERATIALGERLFFDSRLSGNGSVPCASWHLPYRAFQ